MSATDSPLRSGRNSAALLRGALLFRPPAFLGSRDPGARFGAQRALFPWLCDARGGTCTGQQGSDLPETRNLRINFSNQLRCVHSGQFSPEAQGISAPIADRFSVNLRSHLGRSQQISLKCPFVESNRSIVPAHIASRIATKTSCVSSSARAVDPVIWTR